MTTRPKEHLRLNPAKTRTETNHAIPLSGESESLTRACRSEIGGMPMTDAKRMLSVIEFCHRYGIGKTMAYAEMAAGRLPFVKRGRRRLIPVDGAEAWAAPTQISPSALNVPSAVDREGR